MDGKLNRSEVMIGVQMVDVENGARVGRDECYKAVVDEIGPMKAILELLVAADLKAERVALVNELRWHIVNAATTLKNAAEFLDASAKAIKAWRRASIEFASALSGGTQIQTVPCDESKERGN